jgi:hypothetical protein
MDIRTDFSRNDFSRVVRCTVIQADASAVRHGGECVDGVTCGSVRMRNF